MTVSYLKTVLYLATIMHKVIIIGDNYTQKLITNSSSLVQRKLWHNLCVVANDLGTRNTDGHAISRPLHADM